MFHATDSIPNNLQLQVFTARPAASVSRSPGMFHVKHPNEATLSRYVSEASRLHRQLFDVERPSRSWPSACEASIVSRETSKEHRLEPIPVKLPIGPPRVAKGAAAGMFHVKHLEERALLRCT
jgi:hypothetical protein